MKLSELNKANGLLMKRKRLLSLISNAADGVTVIVGGVYLDADEAKDACPAVLTALQQRLLAVEAEILALGIEID